MNIDLQSITPTDLRDFAKAHGWHQLSIGLDKGIFVLSNPAFEKRQLIFPINSDAPDYLDAVSLVLDKLSETQNKPVADVVSALQEQHDDTIRYRIADSRKGEEYIPLSYAVSALNGAKEMLLSAACTVLKPQIHHPRLSRSEAQELVDRSRFRHTEQGSFVIKVSAPVRSMEIEGNLYDHNIPFVRQTTLAINNGLTKLIQAIQTDTLTQLIDESKTSAVPELSSNLCKSVMNFKEDRNDFDLFLDFTWAGVIPMANVTPVHNTIKIQKEYFSRIDDVRRELKSAEEQHMEDVFVATVEHLAGDIGPDGRRAGEVVLNLYKEAEIVRARVNLTPDNYAIADASHMRANSYIKVKGKLRPGNQPRSLTEVSLFELIL